MIYDEITERNHKAFEETLESFSIFIRRHSDSTRLIAESCNKVERKQQLFQIAENCEWIAEKPPHTFWEALQLVWFIQIFLHAEANNAAISFGRFYMHFVLIFLQDVEAHLVDGQIVIVSGGPGLGNMYREPFDGIQLRKLPDPPVMQHMDVPGMCRTFF